MYITPNMGLKAWDLESDPYSHVDLINNAIAIDEHDHTPGRGAPLPVEAIPELPPQKLGVCSVQTPAICDLAVTQPKLAQPAVKNVNIFPAAVENSHIRNDSVSTNKLQNGSVTSPKLGDGSVSTIKIQDSAVAARTIRDGAVGGTKIAGQAVSTGHLDNESVITNKLADKAVTNIKIQDNAVSRSKISPQAVGHVEQSRIPCVHVVINSDKSIISRDFISVSWDENKWDTDGMWNPGRPKYIIIQTPGLYLMEACVMWEDGPTNQGESGRRTRIRRNGLVLSGNGPLTSLSDDGGSAPYRVRLPNVAMIAARPGDEFDFQVYQSTNSSQKISPDNWNTHLSMTWIAPHPGDGDTNLGV